MNKILQGIYKIRSKYGALRAKNKGDVYFLRKISSAENKEICEFLEKSGGL